MHWYLYPLIGGAVGVLGSLFGLGGGFLMVPILLWMGMEAQRAVGTSFVVVFFIASSALFAHFQLENVQWKAGILLALGGVMGAQIGPHILERIPSPLFKKVFAVILMFIALWMFLRA